MAKDRQNHYKRENTKEVKKAKSVVKTSDPTASREEYLRRFNSGKVPFNLPSKYPPNFSCYDSYTHRKSKKEVQLFHQNKVYKIIKDVDRHLKVLGKLNNLHYKIFTEANVNQKVLASNQELYINLSGPQLGGVKEKEKPLFGKTYHLNLRVRDQEKPNDVARLMNFTTALTIMVHELAHVSHQNHGKKFMLLTKRLYCQALGLKMYPPQEEEHMYPSPRDWEREMFRRKGDISDSELIVLFEG